MEKLGPEASDDPGGALVRLGLPRAVVDTIDRASGVGLKNVDQLVHKLATAAAKELEKHALITAPAT